ncbi:hypothetical protein D3C87_1259720 [compost metagenome]
MARSTRRRTRRANVDVTETTFLPDILRKLEDLTKVEVHIGAAADQSGSQEIAMIAGVHEFGSTKMGIPARSFIRSGKKKSQAAASKIAKAGVNEIVHGSETARGLMDKMGTVALEKTIKNFDRIRTPPLSPIYAKRRSGSAKKILVQESKLRESLAYIIVPRGGR